MEAEAIIPLVIESQYPHQKLDTLVQKLLEVYNEVEYSAFLDCLWNTILYLLQNDTSKPVRRAISFIPIFLSSDYLIKDGDCPCLPKITVDILWRLSEAVGCKSRFRKGICNMVHEILKHQDIDVYLDDDLFENILSSMSFHLMDKNPGVRRAAIMAISRLQEPTEDCPVVRQYLYLLKFDPQPTVRYTVLKNIIGITAVLDGVFERTRDVSSMVRVEAFKFIAKRVNYKVLNIKFREQIVEQGFKDEYVKGVVENILLYQWFESCNKNYLEFISCFDPLEHYEPPSLAIKYFLQQSPPGASFDSLQKYMNSKKIIPFMELTVESAFMWKHFIQFLSDLSLNNDIRPEVADMLHLLDNLLATDLPSCDLEKTSFILKELLKILHLFNDWENADRELLKEWITKILLCDHPCIHAIVKECIQLLVQIGPDTDHISEIINIIINTLEMEDSNKHELKTQRRVVVLNVIFEYFQYPKHTLEKHLTTVDKILLDSIQSSIHTVKMLGYKSVGVVCCLDCPQMAMKYYDVLMLSMVLEAGQILSSILSALIDMVLTYGIQMFENENVHQSGKLLDFLLDHLYSQDDSIKMIAIKGAFKLVIRGDIAPQILTHVLVFGFTTYLDSSSALYMDIPNFLKRYIYTRNGPKTVGQIVWSAMEIVLNSPSTSILRKIGVETVGMILLSILQERKDLPELQIQFALDVCNYLQGNSLHINNLVSILCCVVYDPVQSDEIISLHTKCLEFLKVPLDSEERRVLKKWEKILYRSLMRSQAGKRYWNNEDHS